MNLHIISKEDARVKQNLSYQETGTSTNMDLDLYTEPPDLKSQDLNATYKKYNNMFFFNFKKLIQS